MRKYLIALAALSFLAASMPTDAFAQSTGGVKARKKLQAPDDDSDTKTTLAIDDGAFLGYGGFRWGLQSVDGKWVHAFGVRGMWLYAETIAFGIEFAGIDEYHPYDDAAKEGISQSHATWGAVLTKTLWPREEVHYDYGLSFGRGISSLEAPRGEVLAKPYDASRIFYFLAPEASVVLNLTKYTKPFVGARAFIPFAGRGNSEIEESRLAGLSFLVGINVGNFTL